MWQHWVNFVAGVWVIISGYLTFTGSGLATDLTITGLVIAILALWGAIQTQSSTRLHPRMQ